MKSLEVQCPAKINLTLKITGKRDDGFHDLDSIMQTISLFDYLTISVEPSQKFEINLSGTSKEIPYNEKNIVHKAVLLFVERTNLSPHKISIFIEKHIPVAAGLAGGSTDAAGTLWGLNQLFDEALSKEELHELCAKLGSDLNFCLEGGRKQTFGRGEILKPLEFEEFDVSLIKPLDLGISAKEAYTKFAGKNAGQLLNQPSTGALRHPSPAAGGTRREDFVNDLEWAVIDDYVQLRKIKELYPKSIMSGSGSTYYLLNGCFEEMEGYEVFNNLRAISNGITEKNRPL